MKFIVMLLTLTILGLSSLVVGQASPPPPITTAFPSTTVTLNLSPITLPGVKATVAGAETDILINPFENLSVGETTLTSGSMIFAGGRGVYVIKPFSTWVQNHSPSINGYQLQLAVTGSLGVVKPVGSVGSPHWGERAGVVLNYGLNNNWGLGVDAEWGNFPGLAHNVWTLAVGPNFHF